MKICNKCGVQKEEAEFRKPRNGCIACERADNKVRTSVPGFHEGAAAKMREKRKDPAFRKAALDYAADRYSKQRRFLILLKLDRPCYDCGTMFPPEITDWDHIPGSNKKFTLATGISHSLEACIEEISKCQLVCANCHRARTSSRRRKKEKEI